MDNMTESDRNNLRGLERKVEAMNANLQRLLNAVIGDDQAGSIGLVVRIGRLEEKMSKNWERYEAMEDRIEKVESNNMKIFAYSAAIAVVLSIVFNLGKMLFSVWAK